MGHPESQSESPSFELRRNFPVRSIPAYFGDFIDEAAATAMAAAETKNLASHLTCKMWLVRCSHVDQSATLKFI